MAAAKSIHLSVDRAHSVDFVLLFKSVPLTMRHQGTTPHEQNKQKEIEIKKINNFSKKMSSF